MLLLRSPRSLVGTISQLRQFSTAVKTSTIFSPTPSFLSAHLASNPPPTDSLTLYTVCTTLPSLPGLLPHLQSLPNSIGSFSLSPPEKDGFISIAHLPQGQAFHSTLTGRRPVEVGRWHRPHPGGIGKEDRKGEQMGDLGQVGDWGEAWEADAGVDRVEGIDEGTQTILLLSDASPRPVLRALDAQFPLASKAGLLTAPTPFVTGRPHTLLMNDKVFATGAVGVALPYQLQVNVEFGLEPMGDTMIVERSQGNMLLSFTTHPNPAQILISAIQKRGGKGLSKEEDFYLALLDNGGIREAVKIMGGDPGKGALSLEMEDSLMPGQVVQFMQRKPSPLPTGLTFGAIARSETDDVVDGQPRIEEGFTALSEAGFIYSVRGRSSVGTTGYTTIR